METTFNITNKELPKGTRKETSIRAMLLKLSEGQCLEVRSPQVNVQSIRSAATVAGKKAGMKFALRTVEGGIDIYRTA